MARTPAAEWLIRQLARRADKRGEGWWRGSSEWRWRRRSDGEGKPHRARAVAKAKRTPSSASSAGSELQGPPRSCFDWLHDGGGQRLAVTCGRRRLA
jgi:hypothetical protein